MLLHHLHRARFAAPWLLVGLVAAAASVSPWWAWGTMALVQLLLALAERVPALQRSPAAEPQTAWHRACVRLHVPLQAALLAYGTGLIAIGGHGAGAAAALGLAVGGITGSQGITFAHELGHSRSRLDRVLAWCLMASVGYAHFMVEHYRGHHPRAATQADPASARRGESLWRFLPRTLAGSFVSAWRLEAARLRQHKRGWAQSPLLWASVAQLVVLIALPLAFGAAALVFWLVQAAYAVFLLETVNYIEHYGLQRTPGQPFGMQHAWNADHLLTNSLLANLQRHSDHHMHAWKPYAELQPLPGPQLPTGYAGCLFMATVPPLWFAVMHRRLDAAPLAASG
jgi:alkane 1-monooxygenase